MNFDFTSHTLQSYFITISLVLCILKFSICLFDYATSEKQTKKVAFQSWFYMFNIYRCVV